MPWESFEKVDTMLGGDIASEYSGARRIGAFRSRRSRSKARIGGFILPFDVGVKVGFLPEETKALLPSGVTADYLMFGADVRYALLKGGALMPKLTVGAGYTYLKGSVTMADVAVAGSSFDVGGYGNREHDPDLTFDWEASVIDLKAQLSKGFLVLTPYVGVGASLAVTDAGGGLDGHGDCRSASTLTPVSDRGHRSLHGRGLRPEQRASS